MEESSLFADITDSNSNSNSNKFKKSKKVLFDSPLNVIKKYDISSTRVMNDVDINTKLNLDRLQTFEIPIKPVATLKVLKEHFKKFKTDGLGTVLKQMGNSFKKTQGKGLNCCVYYPIPLETGCNIFKLRITSDEKPGVFICFEKPSNSNFVCKTRLLQNGVGIS